MNKEGASYTYTLIKMVKSSLLLLVWYAWLELELVVDVGVGVCVGVSKCFKPIRNSTCHNKF